MKIRVGLKVRYYYPTPFKKSHTYDDGEIVLLTSNQVRIKLSSTNGILLIQRTKENIKQMKVIKHEQSKSKQSDKSKKKTRK